MQLICGKVGQLAKFKSSLSDHVKDIVWVTCFPKIIHISQKIRNSLCVKGISSMEISPETVLILNFTLVPFSVYLQMGGPKNIFNVVILFFFFFLQKTQLHFLVVLHNGANMIPVIWMNYKTKQKAIYQVLH